MGLNRRSISSRTADRIKIQEFFRVTVTYESLVDFTDLMKVTPGDDDVQGFDTRRDEVLSSTKETPQDHMQKICTK